MTFPLLELPQEIIIYHLVNYLDPVDIANLLTACGMEASGELYRRLFRDDVRFTHYDTEMFRQRGLAKLVVFGNTYDCGLGVEEQAWQFETVTSPRSGRKYRRTKTACAVQSVGGEISKVFAGDKSLMILNGQRELFFTLNARMENGYNDYYQGEVEVEEDEEEEEEAGEEEGEEEDDDEDSDPDYIGAVQVVAVDHGDEMSILDSYDRSDSDASYHPSLVKRVLARTHRKDALSPYRFSYGYSSDEHVPDDVQEKSDLYFGLPWKESAFFEASSDNSDYVALDDQGLLWHWCGYRTDLLQGVPSLLVDFASKSLLTGRISKLRYSVSYKCCYVEDVGIALWSREPHAYDWKAGYPCFNGHIDMVASMVVPDTAYGIRDYVVIKDLIVYLKYDGTVAGMAVDDLEHIVWEGASAAKAVNPLAEVNALGHFKQIVGAFGMFSLVSDDGRVYMVRVKANSMGRHLVRAVSVSGLGDLDIASVAIGASHWLALTQDGDVYSCGKENKLCGALGLGTFQEALDAGAEVARADTLVVSTPTKMKLPGRAYAVYAGSDYSAALVYAD